MGEMGEGEWGTERRLIDTGTGKREGGYHPLVTQRRKVHRKPDSLSLSLRLRRCYYYV